MVSLLEDNFGLLKTVDEAVEQLMTALASNYKVVLATIYITHSLRDPLAVLHADRYRAAVWGV